MGIQFAITGVKTKAAATKKARARISRLNKDPREFKGEEIKLTSVKKSKDGNWYIAKTKKR